jgi:DNA polymerase V
MNERHYTGFPSASEEHRRPALNLHTLLAPRPLYTFFARHTGDAMVGANIFDDDLLVIERTSDYADGHIVLAFVVGRVVHSIIHHLRIKQHLPTAS